jgi:hypothetical protein
MDDMKNSAFMSDKYISIGPCVRGLSAEQLLKKTRRSAVWSTALFLRVGYHSQTVYSYEMSVYYT